MKFKNIIKNIWRMPYRIWNKVRLQNHSFTIISSNCIGGAMFHDCFQQFRTPTINLTIKNFSEFCSNYYYYLNDCCMKENGYINNMPVCLLDDIEIIGVHYKTHIELIEAWERRIKRINYDNLFFVATDRDLISADDYKEFDKVPHPKVCFVARKDKTYSWEVFLPEFAGEEMIGDSLVYKDLIGRRIFQKHFDYINWLNLNNSKN